MTERLPRPGNGEFRHRAEYDPSHSEQMTELKLGAISAVHDFLNEYEHAEGTSLEAQFQKHTATMTRLFEAVYEGLPDTDTYKDEHDELSELVSPSSYRRHVTIETRLSRQGQVRQMVGVSVTDLPYTGSSAFVTQYAIQEIAGGSIYATILQNELGFGDREIEETSERPMTPFDFTQFTIHMAELQVAHARQVRDGLTSPEEL